MSGYKKRCRNWIEPCQQPACKTPMPTLPGGIFPDKIPTPLSAGGNRAALYSVMVGRPIASTPSTMTQPSATRAYCALPMAIIISADATSASGCLLCIKSRSLRMFRNSWRNMGRRKAGRYLRLKRKALGVWSVVQREARSARETSGCGFGSPVAMAPTGPRFSSSAIPLRARIFPGQPAGPRTSVAWLIFMTTAATARLANTRNRCDRITWPPSPIVWTNQPGSLLNKNSRASFDI